MEKRTKRENFEALREIVEGLEMEATEQEDMLAFIDKQIETLDKRAEAAVKRAEKKKAESDELTEAIFGMIGDEPVTVDDIVANFADEEVTRNKVTARLGKLVKAGRVVKDTVKVEGKRRMAYSLPGAEEAED